MSQARTIPIEQDQSDYGLFDRLHIYKDKLIANSRFQNTVAKIPPESPSIPSITPLEYEASMTRAKNGMKNMPSGR